MAQDTLQHSFLMTVQVHMRKNLLEYGVVLVQTLNDVDKALLDKQMLLFDVLAFKGAAWKCVQNDLENLCQIRVVVAQSQRVVLKFFS